MWFFRQPDERFLHTFLELQRAAPLSYAEPGLTKLSTPPSGFDLDHNRCQIGTGEACFVAACEAFRRWEQFPRPWTRILPANSPLEVGQTITLLARTFGVWWLNACRIVYTINEATTPRRFGFAYGTLPQHVERGEERFLLEWLADDTVWYDIRAISQPRYWAVRLGYPIARRLQRQFAKESIAAMRKAVLPATGGLN